MCVYINTGKAKGAGLYRWPEKISKPCVGKQPKNKARNGELRNNWVRQQYRKDKENKAEVVPHSLNLKKTCFKPFNISVFISKSFTLRQKLSIYISPIHTYMSSEQTGLGSLTLAAKLRRQFQNWQLKVALSRWCSPGWCCAAVSPLLAPRLGLASSTGSRGGSRPWLTSCPHHLHASQLVLLAWPQTLPILPCLLFPPKPTGICLAGHPRIKE